MAVLKFISDCENYWGIYRAVQFKYYGCKGDYEFLKYCRENMLGEGD